MQLAIQRRSESRALPLAANIAAEKAGRPPPGGVAASSAYRLDLIKTNQEQHTPPSLVTYVINARRAAGLPELDPPPVI